MEKVEIIKKYRIQIMAIFGLLLAFGGYLLFFKEEEPDWEVAPQATTISSELISEMILVDIKGEIKNPGVYELSQGARMQELILMAGGFTSEAEERQLNLAERLVDQQMVYVPNTEEVELVTELLGNETKESLININTADISELQQLSGIGPAKAQAIIDYRDENGKFSSVDELTQVSGFGEKTLDKLRNSIKI